MSEESANIPEQDDSATAPGQTANAWLLMTGKDAWLEPFSATVRRGPSNCRGIHEGDGFLIAENFEGEIKAVAFARMYRKRPTLTETTFYLDGLLSLDPPKTFSALSLPAMSWNSSFTRLDFPAFDGALKAACNVDFASFPVLAGETSEGQAYVRELMQMAVTIDLSPRRTLLKATSRKGITLHVVGESA